MEVMMRTVQSFGTASPDHAGVPTASRTESTSCASTSAAFFPLCPLLLGYHSSFSSPSPSLSLFYLFLIFPLFLSQSLDILHDDRPQAPPTEQQ